MTNSSSVNQIPLTPGQQAIVDELHKCQPMTQPPPGVGPAQWLARYKQRFVEIAGLTEDQAQDFADGVLFEEVSDGFEDDPEGAADEEMSYWEADE